MSYFTVFTPTFNRAYILRRPFESLMKQTFRDFEWLIVDDGSTDETQELVKTFIQEADFNIRYIRQENKGRAAALNTAHQLAQSVYIVNIDSDDAFTEDALQIFYNAWESVPKDRYDRIWCVTAHCVNSVTKKQIGAMWPENINELSGKKQHRIITKYKGGEKHCCRKLAVLQQYPFPSFTDTKFVPESIVWEQIDQKYDQYCINKVVSIYFTDSTDSLSISSNKLSTKHSYYHSSISYVNNCFSQLFYNKKVIQSVFNIGRLAYVTGRKYLSVMADINKWYKKVPVTIVYPITWLFAKFYYRNVVFK